MYLNEKTDGYRIAVEYTSHRPWGRAVWVVVGLAGCSSLSVCGCLKAALGLPGAAFLWTGRNPFQQQKGGPHIIYRDDDAIKEIDVRCRGKPWSLFFGVRLPRCGMRLGQLGLGQASWGLHLKK